jgi:hypothetical protein
VPYGIKANRKTLDTFLPADRTSTSTRAEDQDTPSCHFEGYLLQTYGRKRFCKRHRACLQVLFSMVSLTLFTQFTADICRECRCAVGRARAD